MQVTLTIFISLGDIFNKVVIDRGVKQYSLKLVPNGVSFINFLYPYVNKLDCWWSTTSLGLSSGAVESLVVLASSKLL